MSSQSRRPQIPADMKAFNASVIEEFRANHGKLGGRLAQSRLMLLTTVGRKSGQARTVVIGYRRDGDRYLAIASNNGADQAPQWYFNLRANSRATAEIDDERFEVEASVADREERKRLVDLIDYLPNQQALTKREIPILVFKRI